MVPNGFDAAYTRVLYATDLSGAIVFVNLSAAGAAVPLSAYSRPPLPARCSSQLRPTQPGSRT